MITFPNHNWPICKIITYFLNEMERIMSKSLTKEILVPCNWLFSANRCFKTEISHTHTHTHTPSRLRCPVVRSLCPMTFRWPGCPETHTRTPQTELHTGFLPQDSEPNRIWAHWPAAPFLLSKHKHSHYNICRTSGSPLPRAAAVWLHFLSHLAC